MLLFGIFAVGGAPHLAGFMRAFYCRVLGSGAIQESLWALRSMVINSASLEEAENFASSDGTVGSWGTPMVT